MGARMEKKLKKTNHSAKYKADLCDHVIETALKLTAERGWRSLLLKNIAEEAGTTLEELHRQFSTKTAILNAFQQRIDVSVLASIIEGSTYRDRLFEILMRRFDVLQPYRDAIRLIARDVGFDPLATIILGPQLFSSMALMLEAAGINSSGLDGTFRVKGLMLIYARALRTWLSDDSPDFSETMATLDCDLARAERLAGMLCHSQGTNNSSLGAKPT
jgi:AcrR family transcriptional regulator